MNDWNAALLVDLTLRASAVLLAAIVAVWWLRRRSATVRYAVWVVACSGLLALPLLTFSLPPWRVIPTGWQNVALASTPDAGHVSQPTAGEVPPPRTPADASASPPTTVEAGPAASTPPAAALRATPGGETSQRPTASSLLSLIWVAGFLLILSRIIVSQFWMRRVIRKADLVPSGPLRAALNRLIDEFGWKHSVNLVVTTTGAMPMACGIWSPTILLPPQSKDWTDTQGRSVLLHEFGHILRRDPLSNLLIEISRAVYWFHPLAWLAARLAAAERERACDDLVLRSGVPAVEYARHLLDVVSGGRLSRLHLSSGIAMASRRLDRRLRLLMDAAQDRRPLRRLAVVATLLAGACLLVPIAVARSSEAGRSQDEPPAREREADESRQPQPSEVWNVRLRAVDERTGAPIPNSRFIVQLGGDRWTEHAGDADGEFVAKFATRTPRYCYLKVRADGYAAMQGFWSNRRDEPRDELPEQLVFEMEPSITVGGIVVDEEGEAVEGARVYFGALSRERNQGRRIQQSFWREPFVTDTKGRWQCGLAAASVDSAAIRVEHPDYVQPDPDIMFGLDDQLTELKEQTHRWQLQRGFTIRGRVVDGNGVPLEGVVLAAGELNSYRWNGPFPQTDAEGYFTFARVAPLLMRDIAPESREMTVTAMKPGFAPGIEMIPGFGRRELGSSTPESRIVSFTLRSGREIGFEFHDSDGNPVPDVRVRFRRWRDTDSLNILQRFGIPGQADAEGRWAWDWAPDGVVEYGFEAEGFREQSLRINADGRSRTVILEREQVITGRVVDAGTGEPIPLFYIEAGYPTERQPPIRWMATRGTRGADGAYRLPVHWRGDTLYYRALAEGYEPAESRAVTVEEGEVTLDFELRRTESEEM